MMFSSNLQEGTLWHSSKIMRKGALWKDMLNMKINKLIMETELDKLYAIWLREFKVFLRERSRLIASTFTPLLWLFVIGGGLGALVTNPSESSVINDNSELGTASGMTYQQFIFPGIISMSVIFSSIFFGSYI